MDVDDAFPSISLLRFDQLLQQYDHVVLEKLADLDKTRYMNIPSHLQEQANKPPSLSKDQVATLVDWKLSHGKFRPTLRALVQQNSEDVVDTTTQNAFSVYSASKKGAVEVKAAINSLSKLRGIGPATASLLLSVYDGEHVPFFSDELFRWCMFEDGKAKGWDRPIKYDVKEYLELFGRVQSFRDRCRDEEARAVSSTDIEKVAYVLGKQEPSTAPISSSSNGAKSGEKRKADSTIDATATTPVSKTRKVATTARATTTAATRKSARHDK